MQLQSTCTHVPRNSDLARRCYTQFKNCESAVVVYKHVAAVRRKGSKNNPHARGDKGVNRLSGHAHNHLGELRHSTFLRQGVANRVAKAQKEKTAIICGALNSLQRAAIILRSLLILQSLDLLTNAVAAPRTGMSVCGRCISSSSCRCCCCCYLGFRKQVVTGGHRETASHA